MDPAGVEPAAREHGRWWGTHAADLDGRGSAAARTAGFTLFEGRYFCAPRTFTTTVMPTRRLAYLRLLEALGRENLTVAELEGLVKHDVSLSYRILRLVKSAAFAVHGEVTSIRHALLLVGRDIIRKWTSVWALAGLNDSGTQEAMYDSVNQGDKDFSALISKMKAAQIGR